jgi:hypothetical protein
MGTGKPPQRRRAEALLGYPGLSWPIARPPLRSVDDGVLDRGGDIARMVDVLDAHRLGAYPSARPPRLGGPVVLPNSPRCSAAGIIDCHRGLRRNDLRRGKGV